MQQSKYLKILVVNPYGIGDVLFTTPLLSNLRSFFPNSRICVVLGSRTKQILELNNDVDAVYVFDKGLFDTLIFFKAWKYLADFCRCLRREKFDLVIDLSNSAQYGFVERFFLKIPRRLGFNYRGRGRHLTRSLTLKGFCDKHVADYYLSLLSLLNIPPRPEELKFEIKEELTDKVSEYLAGKKIEAQDTLVVLAPAGGESWSQKASYKHWPQENYAQLADMLITRLKSKIVITGAKEDRDICLRVKNLMKSDAAEIVTNFNIPEFAALCGLCDLVVCNDGGPLHVAVSQKTPTLSFFGPVDEKVYGPYPACADYITLAKIIDCRPCYQNFKLKECPSKDCLRAITVVEAYEAAEKLLTK